MIKAKAVWLDRDGVLNRDSGYTHRIEDCVLMPGVISGLKKLADNHFDLYVVTNQSGVARGLYEESDVQNFNLHLDKIFKQSQIMIKEFAYCPHHLQGTVAKFTVDCKCRKPKTGMITKNLAGYSKRHCYLVGDRPSDIECAVNAGIAGVLIKSSHAQTHSDAAHIAVDFTAAVKWIIQSEI